MVSIHSHAHVSRTARLGSNVSIGPFCVVEDDVELGDGCNLAAGVIVKQGTRLGANNRVFEGTVLGGLPQHARIPAFPGRLEIGSGNVIREHVTMHRALHADAATRVGDNNLLMAGSHVAHDCVVGNNAIFANHVLLAGHVIVEDRAYVSGAVGVHQFCRIGRLAMVGGHARVVQDVPPFMTVDGVSGCIVGLNLVGLRRAGFVAEEINELKAAYRLIYRSGMTWKDMLDKLGQTFTSGAAGALHVFLSQGTRGFVQERRMPPGATLKLRRESDEAAEAEARRAKAG